MLNIFLQLLLTILITWGHTATSEIYFRKGAPHVKLSNNGLLSGSVDYSREGRPFNSFVGVPYGTIQERFHEALLAPAWEGVYDAVKPGPSCVQPAMVSGKVLTFGIEDCLNLNVYVPMNNTGRKGGYPVMVWVHGGAFSGGNGYSYGPQFFMDEDVILITFNYRLGVFGFMSTGDSVIPGNNGLKDQALALRWVQEHIRKFGGDPGKVTVFGESAGGASVHYLMLSPITDGLFQRAISQSGSALGAWTFNPDPKETALKLATYLKCQTSSKEASGISSDEIKECLKSISVQELNEAQLKFNKRWPSNGILLDFVPVQEPMTAKSPFLAESPWQIIMEDSIPMKSVPWMVGTTEDEGIFLYARYNLHDEKLLEELDKNWENVILKTTELERFIPRGEWQTVATKIKKFYFGDKAVSKGSMVSLVNLYSDAWLVHAVWKAAMETASKGDGQQVYLYQHGYHGPVQAWKLFGSGSELSDKDVTMIGHGDELVLQFNLENLKPGIGNLVEADSPHEEFSKQLVKLWVSFAIQGKPNHAWGTVKEEWKPISKTEHEGKRPLTWYKINANPGFITHEGELEERVLFWDQLYSDHILPSLLTPTLSSSSQDRKTEL